MRNDTELALDSAALTPQATPAKDKATGTVLMVPVSLRKEESSGLSSHS